MSSGDAHFVLGFNPVPWSDAKLLCPMLDPRPNKSSSTPNPLKPLSRPLLVTFQSQLCDLLVSSFASLLHCSRRIPFKLVPWKVRICNGALSVGHPISCLTGQEETNHLVGPNTLRQVFGSVCISGFSEPRLGPREELQKFTLIVFHTWD